MAEAKRRKPPHGVAYSERVARLLCERLASGRTLTDVCSAKGMPTRQAVQQWLSDPTMTTFHAMYRRAREEGAHAIVDLAWETAKGPDNPADDNPKNVNRDRLKVDTAKWLASKMLPRVYGDRAEIAHTGADGEPLIPSDTREIGKAILAVLGSARVSAAVQIEPPEPDHTAISNGTTR